MVSFGVTAAAFAWSWPADVIVVVLVVGLLAVFAGGAWLRSRAYVVRVDDDGYDVKFVRGAGVAVGPLGRRRARRWPRTRATSPAWCCGTVTASTTSIPVEMLAVDRDRFADEVKARLDRAHGR